MCWLTKSARANLAGQAAQSQYQTPPQSSCCASSTTTAATTIILPRSLSRTDLRALKHEVRAESRAAKAEIRAHRHEMPKCERKAARRAIKAQVWGDVLARHAIQGQGQVVREAEEGPEYQTLREEEGERMLNRGTVTPPPPRYEDVVEMREAKN